MSATSLDLFVSKVAADSELQQRLARLQAVAPEEGLAEAVKLSEKAGTPVTVEELRSLQWLGDKNGEIFDAELERVAGGGSWLGSLFNSAKVGVFLLQGVEPRK